MAVIWKEYPEINRKVAFTAYAASTSHALGCHCGSINGININFGSRYHAANNGKNVEVLDTTLEKQIAYRKDGYTSVWVTPQSEIKKVIEYLVKINLSFKDFDSNIFEDVVKKCENVPLWILSDAINYEAPARKGPYDPISSEYLAIARTRDFAKYLIDNKIGYVMASPIVQNPAHRSIKNYSLNQGWFWIPPKHLERAVNVASVYGDDKFPKKDKWAETIAADLNTIPDKVFKEVFDEGEFPETSCFLRRRKDGRFAAKEA